MVSNVPVPTVFNGIVLIPIDVLFVVPDETE